MMANRLDRGRQSPKSPLHDECEKTIGAPASTFHQGQWVNHRESPNVRVQSFPNVILVEDLANRERPCRGDYRGSMIPDTNVGGNIAAISEVSDDQETTIFYPGVQAGSRLSGA